MRRKFLIRCGLMVALGLVVYAGLWAYAIATKTNGEQKLAALAAEAGSRGGQVFRTTLEGKPLAFLLEKCTVYLLDVTDAEIKRREVLSTSFYFFLDSCSKQTMEQQGEYVRVHLYARAIGAGGGNTTGGDFRSKDGLTWEKLDGASWIPVEGARP